MFSSILYSVFSFLSSLRPLPLIMSTQSSFLHSHSYSVIFIIQDEVYYDFNWISTLREAERKSEEEEEEEEEEEGGVGGGRGGSSTMDVEEDTKACHVKSLDDYIIPFPTILRLTSPDNSKGVRDLLSITAKSHVADAARGEGPRGLIDLWERHQRRYKKKKKGKKRGRKNEEGEKEKGKKKEKGNKRERRNRRGNKEEKKKGEQDNPHRRMSAFTNLSHLVYKYVRKCCVSHACLRRANATREKEGKTIIVSSSLLLFFPCRFHFT